MIQNLDLIYCASGHKDLATVAIEAGFLYGVQLPGSSYFPLHFVDQNWKNPDFAKYLNLIKRHKPVVCTVLDLERSDQYEEVMMWAEEVSPYVDKIIIIPKVVGIISSLPSLVGGKEVILGYSVPTKFGSTPVPLSEFTGHSVHLLGGSPHKQMALSKGLSIVSVDGNMHQMMATRFCKFWREGKWVSIEQVDGKKWNKGGDGAYKEAFTRSCKNIFNCWYQIND